MATSKSDRTKKTETASVLSKNATDSRRINMQRMQSVLLIWVDKNIDDNNADRSNTIKQLQRVVNNVNTFTDSEQCVEFIQEITNNRVCMIISGSFGEHIVPRVHDMSQVDTIFIFCKNEEFHKQWAKKCPKIKGVFTKITPICEALIQAAHQCEQNATSISFVASNKISDPSFMYTQILKEILLTINFEEKHINEYIHYCYDAFVENEYALDNITKLARDYHDKTPIWWYTYQSFLYTMLNRALRLMDADIIVRMGFFINDLHRDIQRLHSEQFDGHQSSTTFTVYRGQGLSKEDFIELTKTKGGLLSFNNFLSTSRNRNVSLAFAQEAAINPDLVGILFVMSINPADSTTPFASITDVSYFHKEDEVLFSMHTIFRIGDIKQMDGNKYLYQVSLTLTNNNDQDLRTLGDQIRQETFPDQQGCYRLGHLLIKMGQFNKAQEVYEDLLHQAANESDKAPIYYQLGCIKCNQGEYQEALVSHGKALVIRQQSLPSNHPDLAASHNNIGVVYYRKGDYTKALSNYEKALEIRQQSLLSNHPDLGDSYNNIGTVHHSMGDNSNALIAHDKALEIRRKSLPSNHPDLAASYNNIGVVYYRQGDYTKALYYYEEALAIKQQSLPSNHPDLAASYNNIGNVYHSMGDYSKALLAHGKALEIRQQSVPYNHPSLGASYNNIGNVYHSMGVYPKALSFYKKDLAILQQTLPFNHPDLGASHNNIGVAYYRQGDYIKALSNYEKALEIRQESLPSNHPDLAASYNNIGEMHYRKGNYPKALSYHEIALAMRLESLPPNHPDLAASFNNIGLVYKKMNKYSEAYSSHQRAVQIAQKSLPTNHPDFEGYRQNLERIKRKL
ncbi:unnamed protein product [Adineta steineri]|uniref:ADP ribosyltransferase domain-containing protein n=4 Tax=Adineta steineri TaxID=433720 RepID=A0A814BSS5_9BILA|nr:unnamed protein product [Adineta steineri]